MPVDHTRPLYSHSSAYSCTQYNMVSQRRVKHGKGRTESRKSSRCTQSTESAETHTADASDAPQQPPTSCTNTPEIVVESPSPSKGSPSVRRTLGKSVRSRNAGPTRVSRPKGRNQSTKNDKADSNDVLAVFLREIAKKRGGSAKWFYSDDVENNLRKPVCEVRCSKGHVTHVTVKSIVEGGWCSICAGQQQLKRAEMRRVLVSDTKLATQAQEKQRMLIEEAKARLLTERLLQKSKAIPQYETSETLPPSSSSSKKKQPRFRKIDAVDCVRFSKESLTKFEETVHQQALLDIQQDPTLPLECATAIRQVLLAGDNCWTVFKVQQPHRLSEFTESHETFAKIKSAYRWLLLRVHPDKTNHPESAMAFHHLDEAWKVINNLLLKEKSLD